MENTCTGTKADVMTQDIIDEFSKVSQGAILLDFLSEYTPDEDNLWVQPLTGFLTSNRKMSQEEVVQYWSDFIFPDTSSDSYSASFPFAKSRLFYVMETIVRYMGLTNSSNLRWGDFATGEGVLLELITSHYPGISLSATEHSRLLVERLRMKGFHVEQRGLGLPLADSVIQELDVSTLTWVLANCIDPFSVLLDVVARTRIGGMVCVAESSRIMVPSRKSLRDYLSTTMPADLHPSHFSANTLRCLMQLCGLEISYVNRYFDSDVLLVIGKKVTNEVKPTFADNQNRVVEFFRAWDKQTRFFESLREP